MYRYPKQNVIFKNKNREQVGRIGHVYRFDISGRGENVGERV
jgi:hypothetical protein